MDDGVFLLLSEELVETLILTTVWVLSWGISCFEVINSAWYFCIGLHGQFACVKGLFSF